MIICAFAVFPLGAALACNALIGIDELPPEAADGAGLTDGAALGTGVDGAANDATMARAGDAADDASGEDDANLGDDGGDGGDGGDEAGVVPGDGSVLPIGCNADAGSIIGDAGSPDGDAASCGPCHVACAAPDGGFTATCVDGLCGYRGPASGLSGYASTAGFPNFTANQLAIDDKHRVYVAAPNNGTSYFFSSDGGCSQTNNVGGFPSVYLSDAGSGRTYVVGGSTDFSYVENGNATVTKPCAIATSLSASVEAAQNVVYVFSPSLQLVAVTFEASVTCGPPSVSEQLDGSMAAASPLYISKGATGYSLYGGSLSIWSLSPTTPSMRTAMKTLSTDSDSTSPSSTAGAVTADGSLVYSFASHVGLASSDGGFVSWTVPGSRSPGEAVLTANGVAVFPDEGGGPLLAVDIAKGTRVWAAPATLHADRALVADDGMIWASANLNNQGEIVGIDVATGNVRFELTGLDPLADLLLENGELVAQSKIDGHLVFVPVPSHGYDPKSPWPVHGHDNQRTYNAASPLTY